MITTIALEFDGQEILFDKVVAGFAWPSEQPGFCVAVGERIHPIFTSDSSLYYMLGEVENRDIEMLIEGSIQLGARCKVQGFYGRTHRGASGSQKLPVMHFLKAWNTESARRGGVTFHISRAPYIEEGGSVLYHVNLIRKLLKSDQKRLFLEEGSRLRTYLNEISEDPNALTDLKYPAVSALGYAVSLLDRAKDESEPDPDLVASYPPYDPIIGV